MEEVTKESPKPLAFTIDFDDGKPIDTERHRTLLEKCEKMRQRQQHHRRGQSLSKLDDKIAAIDAYDRRQTLSGNLPRKANFLAEIGKRSSSADISDDNQHHQRTKNVRRDNLNLPLRKKSAPANDGDGGGNQQLVLMTQSFQHYSLSSNDDDEEFVRASIDSTPSSQRLPQKSPDVVVTSSSPLATSRSLSLECKEQSEDFVLGQRNVARNQENLSENQEQLMRNEEKVLENQEKAMKTQDKMVANLEKVVKNQEQLLKQDDLDGTFDLVETLSDCGTYTVDAENYSDEQKARMSIDNQFHLDTMISNEQKTADYVNSLQNYRQEQQQQQQEDEEAAEELEDGAKKVAAADDDQTIVDELVKELNDLDALNRTFDMILSSPKTSASYAAFDGTAATTKNKSNNISSDRCYRQGDRKDRGTIISVTSSGAFRPKSDPSQQSQQQHYNYNQHQCYTKQVNLTKTEVQVEAYDPDRIHATFTINRPSSSKTKLTATIVHVGESLPDNNDHEGNNTKEKENVAGENSIGLNNQTLPKNRLFLTAATDGNQLDTRSLLKPTQHYIDSLQEKLLRQPDKAVDDDDAVVNCKTAINNKNNYDARCSRTNDKLEHFQAKKNNLFGSAGGGTIDQTTFGGKKMLNRYQNKVVAAIGNNNDENNDEPRRWGKINNNSPLASPSIRRSSSFSSYNKNNNNNNKESIVDYQAKRSNLALKKESTPRADVKQSPATTRRETHVPNKQWNSPVLTTRRAESMGKDWISPISSPRHETNLSPSSAIHRSSSASLLLLMETKQQQRRSSVNNDRRKSTTSSSEDEPIDLMNRASVNNNTMQLAVKEALKSGGSSAGSGACYGNGNNSRMYNRAFSLRRARLDGVQSNKNPSPSSSGTTSGLTSSCSMGQQQKYLQHCPNTPEMRRKFPPNSSLGVGGSAGGIKERSVSMDRTPTKQQHQQQEVQSRYLLNLNRNRTTNASNINAPSPRDINNKLASVNSKKKDADALKKGGKLLKKPPPMMTTSTAIGQSRKSNIKTRPSSGGARSNSSLSSREVDFQNWKRRKSYDPMKSAAEGKRRQLMMMMAANNNKKANNSNKQQTVGMDDGSLGNRVNKDCAGDDCDSSPSSSSSVHRSQSFHGTAALDHQLIRSENDYYEDDDDDDDDLTLSMDDDEDVDDDVDKKGFSPPTPSPCELSPKRSDSLRYKWQNDLFLH